MIPKPIALSVLALFAAACSVPLGSEGPTPAAPKSATVTDLSVPFATSESDALVPRGFQGLAAFGRLNIGCVVEVLKTTDRAAQVKLVSCSKTDDRTAPIGTQGWVAKSALDLKP